MLRGQKGAGTPPQSALLRPRRSRGDVAPHTPLSRASVSLSANSRHSARTGQREHSARGLGTLPSAGRTTGRPPRSGARSTASASATGTCHSEGFWRSPGVAEGILVCGPRGQEWLSKSQDWDVLANYDGTGMTTEQLAIVVPALVAIVTVGIVARRKPASTVSDAEKSSDPPFTSSPEGYPWRS